MESQLIFKGISSFMSLIILGLFYKQVVSKLICIMYAGSSVYDHLISKITSPMQPSLLSAKLFSTVQTMEL